MTLRPHMGNDTALLVIDAQVRIDAGANGQRKNAAAEPHIAQLLDAWRQTGRSVFHIRHDSTKPCSPLTPGTLGHAFKPGPRRSTASLGGQFSVVVSTGELLARVARTGG